MSLGLTVVLSFPLIGMMVWIVRIGGPYFYFYVWAFMLVVSILMITIYPTVIAPLFNKYTKLDKGNLFHSNISLFILYIIILLLNFCIFLFQFFIFLFQLFFYFLL